MKGSGPGATASLSSFRPTREQIAAAVGGTVPDVIEPGLRLLFVGINPSLYSAAVGHHFARPGNRFWRALADSGLTDHVLSPFEDGRLLESGCGITNIVPRATARADELSADELVAGGRRLAAKARRLRIGTLAFLGVTAYRAAFGARKAAIGPQRESGKAKRIGGAAVWVLPNPSGLNAHYQRADFARLFLELRRGV